MIPTHLSSSDFWSIFSTTIKHVRVDAYLDATAKKVSGFGVFLAHTFPHLYWIISALRPNAEKYGPEKRRIRTLFTQWTLVIDFSLEVHSCFDSKVNVLLQPPKYFLNGVWMETCSLVYDMPSGCPWLPCSP